MDEQKFTLNADTINALVTAMGALTYAVTNQLSPAQQKAFQKDLMALSRSRNAVGDTTAGTMILDLAGAAEAAARKN